MRTQLTVALLACAALIAGPSVLAQAKGGLAGQDLKYFRELARGNIAEVAAGKLAGKKAASDDVKKFARRMVEDHGKMLEEQKELAKKKGVRMPTGAGKEHKAELKQLGKLSGEHFDHTYMDEMVKDHEKDLKLVEEAQRNVKDPELKAGVDKAAPIIQQHLEMAKQIAAKIGK